MTGSITATCGHKVDSVDDLITVIYHGEDCDAIDGFVPCVFYSVYCPTCAEEAKKWPEYLPTHEAADAWLDAQHDN